MKGLIGKKVGMTQVYDDKGILIPVTVIEAGPCVVVGVKTKERDGYQDDNARLLAQTGAARIIPNAECSPGLFRGILSEFLDDPDKFRQAGKAALAMAQPQAASNVIRFIDSTLQTIRSGKH